MFAIHIKSGWTDIYTHVQNGNVGAHSQENTPLLCKFVIVFNMFVYIESDNNQVDEYIQLCSLEK